MKAKIFVGLMNGIRRSTCNMLAGITAYADEPATPQDEEGDGAEGGQAVPKPEVNFEDLVQKARSDEKRKQYKKIEDLTNQVNDLTSKNNNLMLKVGELEQSLSEAEQKLTKASSGDSEEVKTLKSEVEKLKSDLEKANGELKGFKDAPPVSREDVEKEVREELEKEYEVKMYRTEKIAQYASDPTVLPELVTGETKEDIDATLKAALERSKEIKKSLGLNLDGTPDQRKNQAAFNSLTASQPLNPAIQNAGTGSSEDIMKQLVSLDVRSPEYAKMRKELGL